MTKRQFYVIVHDSGRPGLAREKGAVRWSKLYQS